MAHNGDGTFDGLSDSTILPGILAIVDCSGEEPASGRMIDLAVDCVAALGTDVTILDLRDLDLPPYGNRDDTGLPQGAYAFRQLVCAHDGFLIRVADDNRASASLLLNAIAWSLCPDFGTDATDAYAGKCASLITVATSSGDLNPNVAGLTAKLTQLGVLVMPTSMSHAATPAEDEIPLDEIGEHRMKEQMTMFISMIRWTQDRSGTGSGGIAPEKA